MNFLCNILCPGLQFPPPSPHPLGGPTLEPTKQKVVSDYVYITVWNAEGKVTKMVKVWNIGEAFNN